MQRTKYDDFSANGGAMEKYFKELAGKMNIELKENEINLFFKYKDILKEWNQKINLTAITEDKDIILKHFIDSLTIEKYIMENSKVIDVGTGAGFPGIPLKIIKKKISLTLLDSLNKRLLFLENVKEKLCLDKIEFIHGRAEDFGNDEKHREKYDVATARAVANLSVLAEYCLPFVKVNGYFVCMKGSNIEEVKDAEKAIDKLGGKIEKIENLLLPESDEERNIIIIKKIKTTPKEFPRKAGIPSRKPIK